MIAVNLFKQVGRSLVIIGAIVANVSDTWAAFSCDPMRKVPPIANDNLKGTWRLQMDSQNCSISLDKFGVITSSACEYPTGGTPPPTIAGNFVVLNNCTVAGSVNIQNGSYLTGINQIRASLAHINATTPSVIIGHFRRALNKTQAFTMIQY